MYKDKDKFIILITGGRSSGKCLKRDTLVMMSDLTVKPIQDICVGDKVMGDDGTPRTVLETHSGFGDLYRVSQVNAEDYVVNENHILTLYNDKDVEDIEIQHYINGRYNLKGVKAVFEGNNIDHYEYSDITITKEPEQGEWYGFGIDGNHRFLLADGTITHNSFQTGTFIERLTFELGETEGKRIAHQILYTRYTMVSAGISVIPEFMDKIEADGTSKYFHKTKTDVTNVSTGSRVMFRGINTSSGNQTAKLKSIHGITTFVVDEAEEWTSEQEFDTIMLSIRQKGLQNRIIVIMNPSDSNHFIYQRYIKDTHRIEMIDGVPVQISTHPNVLHIHTTYLDNIEHCGEQFLKEVRDMKEKNPEKYAHIVIGRWADVAEGAIFKKWGIVDEFPANAKNVGKGLDFGYTCFRGDTLITTMRGDVCIKDVTEGDMVLTRNGWHRVTKVLSRGVKRVINSQISVGGEVRCISATADHKFLINGRWNQYGELGVGDVLCTLSSTREKSTRDTQTASILITIITMLKKMVCGLAKCCTMQSIKRILVKFLMGVSYITKTATLSTTRLTTLLRSHLRSIARYMTTLKIFEHLRLYTRNASTKIIGIKEDLKCLTACKTKHVFVNHVVRSLLQAIRIKGFVTPNVITNTNTMLSALTRYAFVNGVKDCSMATSTSNQNVVVTNAPISYHSVTDLKVTGEEDVEVFDLSIEGEHEFFANGIMVHNCDPSACVKFGEVYTPDGVDLYLDEQFYQQGMLISDLIRELKKDNLFVYADSADPRLIDEIGLGGVIIYGVVKGAGSILAGIEKMLDYNHIYVTKRSYNLQEELRNYTWDKDKNGNYINQPIDAYNHAIDSARYGVLGKIMGKVIRKEMKQGNSGKRPVAFSLN